MPRVPPPKGNMTDIAARWADAEHTALARNQTGGTTGARKFRYYKPFVNAVDAYVAEARDGERIFFGIPEFDSQIRGIGRGQLCVLTGYSHSGKTLLLAHILKHNAHKRVALFTPDEPAQLVLAKLAALTSGVPADKIEDMVTAGDQTAVELLRNTALIEFPNLLVFDKPLRGEDMDAAMEEATLVWGDKAELVVLDYLELLQAGETVQQKGEFVKAFTSRWEVPFILVHQSSRTAGADGKRQTISSGTYGGEQLATFQLGVWRKKSSIGAELIEVNDRIARAVNGATDQMLDKRAELLHELERAEFTLTVAITKNKRPGRREGREEIDFELFGDTGLLVPLADGDLPAQYRAKLQAQNMLMVREAQPVAPSWDQQEIDTAYDEYDAEQW